MHKHTLLPNWVGERVLALTELLRPGSGDVEADFWLAFDLLRSAKDHAEFSVVRDWVRSALSVRPAALYLPSLHYIYVQDLILSLAGRTVQPSTQCIICHVCMYHVSEILNFRHSRCH